MKHSTDAWSIQLGMKHSTDVFERGDVRGLCSLSTRSVKLITVASRHGAPWILSMKLSVFIYLSEERDFKHYGLLCNVMLKVNPTGYLLVPWFVVEFTAICLEHSSCPIYEHYLSCQNRVRS